MLPLSMDSIVFSIFSLFSFWNPYWLSRFFLQFINPSVLFLWFDFTNHAFLVLTLSNIPFTPPANNPSLQFFLWFVTFRNDIISNTNCSGFPRVRSNLSGQRYICLHGGTLMDCYGLGKISIPWRVLYIKLLVFKVTGRCHGPLKGGAW